MTDQQFDRLLVKLDNILIVAGPHSLEILAWIALIVTAITAVYAMFYARHQIQAARDNTKAIFLADLDRRWEGAEMKEARSKWRVLRNEIIVQVDKNHAHLNPGEKLKKRGQTCASKLHGMLINDVEGYTHIISILGFYETIGYLIFREFLTVEDIVELYGDSIREYDTLCFDHIEKRRRDREADTGVPTDLYEHARNLILETRGYYEKKKKEQSEATR